MGQSHVKRRERERPLRRHRTVAALQLDLVCGDLRVDVEPDRKRDLIEEVVRLASPKAYSLGRGPGASAGATNSSASFR